MNRYEEELRLNRGIYAGKLAPVIEACQGVVNEFDWAIRSVTKERVKAVMLVNGGGGGSLGDYLVGGGSRSNECPVSVTCLLQVAQDVKEKKNIEVDEGDGVSAKQADWLNRLLSRVSGMIGSGRTGYTIATVARDFSEVDGSMAEELKDLLVRSVKKPTNPIFEYMYFATRKPDTQNQQDKEE